MVHIYKEMMEDENDYFRLCAKYKERVVYRRYLPEINGVHHTELRERERLENLGQSNQHLDQAERKKLLDEELANMKEERELEALRKRSKLNFCKPRTSKVQGQE